jgi:hypothetical protein
MFTTDTGERYTLYQRVEDRTGLDPGTDVICLTNRCYVRVAEISAAKLEERSRRAGGLETVRRRFRPARDAHDGVQRVAPAESSRAVAHGEAPRRGSRPVCRTTRPAYQEARAGSAQERERRSSRMSVIFTAS